jgi:general secretion pathway protein J
MKISFRLVRSPGGFTLAEILLAIFIFSIISVTIYSSLHSVLFSARMVERNIARNETAKNCLNRMIADIQALMVAMPPEHAPPDINEEADPYRIVGDTSYIGSATFPRLRFVSSAHIQFVHQRPCGFAEIVYYVQEVEDDHYVLRRADHCYPFEPFEPSARDPIVCDPLKSLKIIYYDADETPYETWHSDREEFRYATPVAIDIVLEIGDDESASIYEVQISPRVVRMTND